MDMLNATVAMSLGTEQSGVRFAPPGNAKIEGTSFAKSFDEGVLAVNAEAAMATEKRLASLPDFKNGVTVTIPDEFIAMPDQAMAKTVVGKAATSDLGDAKNVIVAKSVSSGKKMDATVSGSSSLRAAPFGKVLSEFGGIEETDGEKDIVVAKAGLGTQVKTVADTVAPVQSAIPEGKVDKAAGDISRAWNGVPTAQVADPSSMQQVSVAQPARPVVLSRDEEDVAKQDVEGTGGVKLESGVPMKKTAKGQESAAAVRVGHKADSAVEHITETVTTSVAATDAPISATPVLAMAVPVTDQQSGTGKGSESSASIVVTDVMERSAGAVSGTNDRGGKESSHPGRVSAEDATSAVTAVDDPGYSSKSGSGSAKAGALATPATSNDEGKLQSGNAGLAHAVAGSAGIVSGMVAGVASTHVVVSDLASAKAQSGAPVGHSATLFAASGEMDGSSVIAAPSMYGAHRTLIATPTALEVGISNGTHGWLKVRAEMAAGGGVNASLSIASASGQEMLHRELPSLTAYLQQEQVGVNTVVVHAPVAGTDSHGLPSGMGGGASGQAQQRNSQGGEGRQAAVNASPNYMDETGYESPNGVGADGLVLPVTYAGGGSWVSVRA